MFIIIMIMAVFGCAASSLHEAVQRGDYLSVLSLIRSGSNVNALDNHGRIPLHFAAEYGNVRISELLIQSKSLLNVQEKVFGWTPLHFAAFEGRLLIIRLLLSKHAQVNIRATAGHTPLFCAVQSSRTSSIEVLLHGGADPSIPETETAMTPLHIVRSEAILECLIKFGAFLEVKDLMGRTPVYYAYTEEIVALYLSNGVKTTMVDIFGISPLNYYISTMKHSRLLIALINGGANIDFIDPFGWTPLHVAANEGNIEAVRVLLERGADATVRVNGMLAEDFAYRNEFYEIVDLFHQKLK